MRKLATSAADVSSMSVERRIYGRDASRELVQPKRSPVKSAPEAVSKPQTHGKSLKSGRKTRIDRLPSESRETTVGPWMSLVGTLRRPPSPLLSLGRKFKRSVARCRDWSHTLSIPKWSAIDLALQIDRSST